MIVGIDIGGTKTWIGRFEDGSLLTSRKIKTKKNPEIFINDLKFLIHEFIGHNQKNLKAIGIGAPGPLNIDNGIFGALPNLPDWEGFHLKSTLERAYSVPVRIQNDANAAALGEALYEGGKYCSSVYYITMSTGIGGGLTAGKSNIVELIRERVRSRIFFKNHANTPIERAILWDDAVLYGALSLFGEIA